MLHPHVPEMKNFGKHLFATFLGLLMAIGLEQWREHHHEVKLADQALVAVETELREDLNRVNLESSRCEQSIRTAEAMDSYLAALITAKRLRKPLPTTTGEFGQMGISLDFATDAWETLKSLGALRQLTPDRALRLSRAYLRLGLIRQRFESHPVLRQIPGTFFLQWEKPERLQALELVQLEQAREAAQLMGLIFRWAQHEISILRESCESALKS